MKVFIFELFILITLTYPCRVQWYHITFCSLSAISGVWRCRVIFRYVTWVPLRNSLSLLHCPSLSFPLHTLFIFESSNLGAICTLWNLHSTSILHIGNIGINDNVKMRYEISRASYRLLRSHRCKPHVLAVAGHPCKENYTSQAPSSKNLESNRRQAIRNSW